MHHFTVCSGHNCYKGAYTNDVSTQGGRGLDNVWPKGGRLRGFVTDKGGGPKV